MKSANPFASTTPTQPSRIRTLILLVLSAQAVVFSLLLMQGCKPAAQAGASTDLSASLVDTNTTNAAFSQPDGTNLPLPAAGASATSAPALAVSNAMPVPLANVSALTPPSTSSNSPMPVATAAIAVGPSPAPALRATCTVLAGDSFYKIALANHVSMRALKAANPKVNPHKLKVGQVIQLPSIATADASSVANPMENSPALPVGPASAIPTLADTTNPGASDHALYVVRPGDTLARIARTRHTTIRELRSLNNLTSDRIAIGQKLKLAEAGSPI